MSLTQVINGAIVAVLLIVFGTLKVVRQPAMVRQADHLGYTADAFVRIGLVEWAGAVGIVVGFWWMPIGVAASVGVLVLLVLAVRAHLVAGDGIVRALGAIWLGALTVASGVAAVLS